MGYWLLRIFQFSTRALFASLVEVIGFAAWLVQELSITYNL